MYLFYKRMQLQRISNYRNIEDIQFYNNSELLKDLLILFPIVSPLDVIAQMGSAMFLEEDGVNY